MFTDITQPIPCLYKSLSVVSTWSRAVTWSELWEAIECDPTKINLGSQLRAAVETNAKGKSRTTSSFQFLPQKSKRACAWNIWLFDTHQATLLQAIYLPSTRPSSPTTRDRRPTTDNRQTHSCRPWPRWRSRRPTIPQRSVAKCAKMKAESQR